MSHPLLRADAQANRIRLIEAAHEVFRERGLDAEMKAIAERAGVGIATLYRNFATKEDLVAAMMAEVQGRMEAAVTRARSQDDPIEALCRLLRTGCEMLDQYGYLMSVLHQDACDDASRHFDKRQEIIGAVIGLLNRGIAAGIFRADLDVEFVALRVLTSLLPPLYRHLRQTRSLDEIVAAHMDLLLHGMQPPHR